MLLGNKESMLGGGKESGKNTGTGSHGQGMLWGRLAQGHTGWKKEAWHRHRQVFCLGRIRGLGIRLIQEGQPGTRTNSPNPNVT